MLSTKLEELFQSFNSYKIMVIGDVMIDAYLWGNVDRISPEAPVPVVACTKRENRLGGAANVALNIQALGAEPVICSVIGKDDDAKTFFSLLEKRKLDSSGILTNAQRTTTVKTRIISANHHLLRVDRETTQPLEPEMEQVFITHINRLLDENKFDAIIFQDYDKGVITKKVIAKVVTKANKLSIPILVDPKKRNFNNYKKVTLFKPNFKEFTDGLKVDIPKSDFHEIHKVAQELHENSKIKYVLITLSELGIFISFNGSYHQLPAEVRDIADVSGAGDTVISVASLCLPAELSPEYIAIISNLAGGLVCEKAGVVPIDKEQLLNECISYFKSF